MIVLAFEIFRIWFLSFLQFSIIDQLWQFAQQWHNKTYLRSKSKVLYSRNNMIKRGKSETIWNEFNFFEHFEEEEVEGGRGRDREPLFVVENDDCQLVCKNVSFYNMFERITTILELIIYWNEYHAEGSKISSYIQSTSSQTIYLVVNSFWKTCNGAPFITKRGYVGLKRDKLSWWKKKE